MDDPFRYPTLIEALRGALYLRSWPMGPDEAASIAADTAEAHAAGTLPRCECGAVVVLCQHHQPWKPLVRLG